MDRLTGTRTKLPPASNRAGELGRGFRPNFAELPAPVPDYHQRLDQLIRQQNRINLLIVAVIVPDRL